MELHTGEVGCVGVYEGAAGRRPDCAGGRLREDLTLMTQHMIWTTKKTPGNTLITLECTFIHVFYQCDNLMHLVKSSLRYVFFHQLIIITWNMLKCHMFNNVLNGMDQSSPRQTELCCSDTTEGLEHILVATNRSTHRSPDPTKLT